MGNPTAEKLALLAGQVADGSLRCEIQAVYPLAEVSEAHAAFARGTRGKIVLTI